MIDSVTKGIADVLFKTLDSQKKTMILTIIDFSDGHTINNVLGNGHDIQIAALAQLLILAGRMPEAKRDDFLKAAKSLLEDIEKEGGYDRYVENHGGLWD